MIIEINSDDVVKMVGVYIFIIFIVIGLFYLYGLVSLVPNETQTPLADFLEEEGRDVFMEDISEGEGRDRTGQVCKRDYNKNVFCFNVGDDVMLNLGTTSICQKLWWEERGRINYGRNGCDDGHARCRAKKFTVYPSGMNFTEYYNIWYVEQWENITSLEEKCDIDGGDHVGWGCNDDPIAETIRHNFTKGSYITNYTKGVDANFVEVLWCSDGEVSKEFTLPEIREMLGVDEE